MDPKTAGMGKDEHAYVVLTDADFDRVVLQSDLPVLVDFWATWCGPCALIGPVIEDIAKELQGKVVVGKMDVDQHNVIAEKYGIMSIPTMLIFHQGKVVEQLVGAQHSKQSIVERLQKYMGPAQAMKQAA